MEVSNPSCSMQIQLDLVDHCSGFCLSQFWISKEIPQLLWALCSACLPLWLKGNNQISKEVVQVALTTALPCNSLFTNLWMHSLPRSRSLIKILNNTDPISVLGGCYFSHQLDFVLLMTSLWARRFSQLSSYPTVLWILRDIVSNESLAKIRLPPAYIAFYLCSDSNLIIDTNQPSQV